MSFRFPYSPTTVKTAPGRLHFAASDPEPYRLTAPISPPALTTIQPFLLRQDAPGRGPLPESAAALPSAGPPSPGIARPRGYHCALRLCWKFTSQKGIRFRLSGTSPYPGSLAGTAQMGRFPRISRSENPRLPKRELIEILVHGYNITSTPPNRPASRPSSLSRVSRPWPPPVPAVSLPMPARRLPHG